jgi:hypothetical protein
MDVTVSSSLTIIGRWKNQRKLQVERKSTAHDHPVILESMRKGMSQAGAKSWLGSAFSLVAKFRHFVEHVFKKEYSVTNFLFLEENKFLSTLSNSPFLLLFLLKF